MSLIIRDDDLSYWTNPKDIDRIYKPLFEKKMKIYFATIPYSVKMYNAGNFDTFYQKTDEKNIGKNKEIKEYVKETIDIGTGGKFRQHICKVKQCQN